MFCSHIHSQGRIFELGEGFKSEHFFGGLENGENRKRYVYEMIFKIFHIFT